MLKNLCVVLERAVISTEGAHRVSLVNTGAQNGQNKHWLWRGTLLFIRSGAFRWLVSAITQLDATVSYTEDQECSDFLLSRANV